MNSYSHAFYALGEQTLLVEWPQEITADILKAILQLEAVLKKGSIPGIIEWNMAYQSMAIVYDPEITSFQMVRGHLQNAALKTGLKVKRSRWAIPVCYDVALGTDLESFCQAKNMEVSEVARLHSSVTYTLHFLGFLPGFMYLGGLPEALHLHRKPTPSRLVPKGSVAIGGRQTGIYPGESPGGWHAIGKCPVSFFDPHHSPPCFMQPGDEIRLQAIDLKSFAEIEKQIASGSYKPTSERIDG